MSDRHGGPYGHYADFPTRWNDNDQYGHVNNAVYYEAMDTTINSWLIGAGLDPSGGEHIAVCASSSCEYRASVTYPEVMRVGLRAGKVGRSSVTWELAIHRSAPDAATSPDDAETDSTSAEPVASGRFVHVFVDAGTRRPAPIPPDLRARIERDLVR